MPRRDTFRIAHFLARCGVASRRKAEEYVRSGHVTVNGEPETNLARQVDPVRDQVHLEGRLLRMAAQHLTLALNKPVGTVVTRSDPQCRPTVYDLLRGNHAERAAELVYVGRLDFLTAGLLILTTDGELANRLTHPRHHVEKAYRARLDRALTPGELERLRAGVTLEDGPTQPCQAHMLPGRGHHCEVVLREGRNRQVRRMIEAIGARVEELRRTRIGALELDSLGLAPGEATALDEARLALLEKSPAPTPGGSRPRDAHRR